MTGVLAAFISAIGDEINAISGLYATRLTATIEPGDTIFPVETTEGWSSSGQLRVDRSIYRYGSKTDESFLQIQHFDLDRWVTGAEQRHLETSAVLDWTRDRTALDTLRRSFFVNYATGSDLDVVARNEGVFRHPQMGSDDIFRAYLKLVAYGSRGSPQIIRDILTVVLGPGKFDVFEDLTKGAEDDPPSRHNVLFIRAESPSIPVGAAYLEDTTVAALASSTASTALPASISAVTGARPPIDTLDRIVALGTGATSSGSEQVVLAAGSFPSSIRPGDIFEITDGPLRGRRASVSANSLTSLSFSPLPGLANRGNLPDSLSGAGWLVRRTPLMFAQPATEDGWAPKGDGGTIADGNLTITGTDDGYERSISISPESQAIFSIHFKARSSNLLTSFVFFFSDEERVYTAGLSSTFSGFFNGGSFLSPFQTKNLEQTWVIKKNGRKSIELTVNNSTVVLSPSAFPTVAEYQASSFILPFASPDPSRKMGFGAIRFSIVDIYSVNWRIGPHGTDRFARSIPLTSHTTTALIAAENVTHTPLGARVIVQDYNARNSRGGNIRGSWIVSALEGLQGLSITGEVIRGCRLDSLNNAIVFPPATLRWPDCLGQRVSLTLAGANSGLYTIVAGLDDNFTEIAAANPAYTPYLSSVETEKQLPPIYISTVQIATLSGEDPELTPFQRDISAQIVPVLAPDASPADVLVGRQGRFNASTRVVSWPLNDQGDSAGDLVAFETVQQSSAHLIHPDLEADSTSNPYAFYIHDSAGYLRQLLQDVVLAGTRLDFDNLSRNPTTGLHISGRDT